MTVATAVHYETIIGLEVHAQLLTASKMYCSCSADYANAEPNTHVCQTCLGLPGAMPVMNRAAIEKTILTGLVLQADIPSFSKLDRKNYGYPDLPKGYQISQYDLPLCVGGSITFNVDGRHVTAGITRVHIEEDTGRLVHRSVDGTEISLVDLNRSGVPLMEIVGDPDLRSPEEAREYLMALRQVLRYIGVSTGNMEEGAFRCDANISIRATDGSFVGRKVEIKNMNSFRSVERALKFEEIRQRDVAAAGGDIPQETRGWVEADGVTVSQRTKEQAHDYRYFPEPDLPPLNVSSAWLDEIRSRMPELPAARSSRFVESLGISEADARTLTSERALADFLEAAIDGDASLGRMAANWIVNDGLGLAKARGLDADQLPFSVEQLRDLLQALNANELTIRAARELLPQMRADELPRDSAKRLNLLSMDDLDALREAVGSTLAAFPAAVSDYRNGKKAAIGRLIGETIKATGGRANPDTVRGLIEEALSSTGE